MLFHQRLGLCLILVGVNAAPGAFIAWWAYDRIGVVAGIAIWLLVYVFISQMDVARDALNDRRFRRAIFLALVARCVPLCWIPDLMIGGFVERKILRFGAEYDPLAGASLAKTAIATLLHGLAMSAFFWALVIILHYRMFLKNAGKNREHLCASCGYDLRASPIRCPECGTPNPNPNHAPLTEPQAQAPD